MASPIRVAVLTISDTASADTTADKSGPTIREILTSQGFQCGHHDIVPDDERKIKSAVLGWVAKGEVDWIVTTGGTGFGVRDRTPEAITPLLDRHAPGLVHLMISGSLAHTAMAALARPVAGTIGNTLVVTLPGSVKAVKENLEALLHKGLVGHVIELIGGGSGRGVHSQLAKEGTTAFSGEGGHAHGHHLHHHHHDHGHQAPVPRSVLSHDPSLPASARHRESPFPIIPLSEALKLVMENIKPLGAFKTKVTPALKGHVLAEDVYAPQDVPTTYTTSVDGYALRSIDPPGTYPVLTSTNHRVSDLLPERTIYRINTGAPLPVGADTVIMVEDTRLASTVDDESKEEKEVETLAQVPKGENVRAPGSDVEKGEKVLSRGAVIRAGGGEVGTLAFVGRKEVEVYKKPRVAILSTGNEILDIQSQAQGPEQEWGGIWDTNRPSLHATLEGMGYEIVDLGIVRDDIDAHKSAIARGLADADILLSTGGTSMGPSDLLKPIIERDFNGTIHFGRVAVKPGKPTTFATVNEKPVFALPGNPASALVCFNVFVVPALRRMGGWEAARCQLPRVKVQIQSPMRLDPRPEYHRVVLRSSLTSDGPTVLKAYSTGGQRSSRMSSLSGANGLVALPGGQGELKQGACVDAVIIGEIERDEE
ncbi:molybdenum cofactor biosynthesis protein [Heliocybe sulcata]|uniref:Molybdenum cofactor biosynthesis protein n=1 Tax=Heliocybe sulcata TaxID=5364 RepID=A0A5C3NCL6_9AGAM|nr:molybdenum cofactor biosynthesis protein [Heliocybe sulcata]